MHIHRKEHSTGFGGLCKLRQASTGVLGIHARPHHLTLVLPLMPHNPHFSKSQKSHQTILNEAALIRGQKELGSVLMEPLQPCMENRCRTQRSAQRTTAGGKMRKDRPTTSETMQETKQQQLCRLRFHLYHTLVYTDWSEAAGAEQWMA